MSLRRSSSTPARTGSPSPAARPPSSPTTRGRPRDSQPVPTPLRGALASSLSLIRDHRHLIEVNRGLLTGSVVPDRFLEPADPDLFNLLLDYCPASMRVCKDTPATGRMAALSLIQMPGTNRMCQLRSFFAAYNYPAVRSGPSPRVPYPTDGDLQSFYSRLATELGNRDRCSRDYWEDVLRLSSCIDPDRPIGPEPRGAALVAAVAQGIEPPYDMRSRRPRTHPDLERYLPTRTAVHSNMTPHSAALLFSTTMNALRATQRQEPCAGTDDVTLMLLAWGYQRDILHLSLTWKEDGSVSSNADYFLPPLGRRTGVGGTRHVRHVDPGLAALLRGDAGRPLTRSDPYYTPAADAPPPIILLSTQIGGLGHTMPVVCREVDRTVRGAVLVDLNRLRAREHIYSKSAAALGSFHRPEGSAPPADVYLPAPPSPDLLRGILGTTGPYRTRHIAAAPPPPALPPRAAGLPPPPAPAGAATTPARRPRGAPLPREAVVPAAAGSPREEARSPDLSPASPADAGALDLGSTYSPTSTISSPPRTPATRRPTPASNRATRARVARSVRVLRRLIDPGDLALLFNDQRFCDTLSEIESSEPLQALLNGTPLYRRLFNKRCRVAMSIVVSSAYHLATPRTLPEPDSPAPPGGPAVPARPDAGAPATYPTAIERLATTFRYKVLFNVLAHRLPYASSISVAERVRNFLSSPTTAVDMIKRLLVELQRRHATPPPERRSCSPSSSADPNTNLAHSLRRIINLCQEGHLAKAYSVLERCIPDTIPPPGPPDPLAPDTGSRLRDLLLGKHPRREYDLESAQVPVGADKRMTPLRTFISSRLAASPRVESLTREQVMSSLHGIRKGAAPGPGDCTAELLIDMISVEDDAPSDHSTGHRLSDAMHNYVKAALAGHLSPTAYQYMGDSRLVGIPKGNDDIRPIAVGTTDGKLAAKALLSLHSDLIYDLLAKFQQLGVGVRGAREASVLSHAIRRETTEDLVILLLDLINAFNSLRRDRLLAIVADKVPEMLPFVARMLVPKMRLWLAPHCRPAGTEPGPDWYILSEEGVRQGEPLSPFLFALAMVDITEAIRSAAGLGREDLLSGYLDDLTGQMSRPAALRVLHHAPLIAAEYNLRFQLNKSHVYESPLAAGEPSAVGEPRYPLGPRPPAGEWPGIRSTSAQPPSEAHPDGLPTDGVKLLGAPLGSTAFAQAFLDGMIDKLRPIAKLLGHLGSVLRQPVIAAAILRCVLANKMAHMARTLPPSTTRARFERFDALLQDTFLDIINDLATTTLPVPRHLERYARAMILRRPHAGGMGVRSTATCAHSAFTTGVLHSLPLISQLLSLDTVVPRVEEEDENARAARLIARAPLLWSAASTYSWRRWQRLADGAQGRAPVAPRDATGDLGAPDAPAPNTVQHGNGRGDAQTRSLIDLPAGHVAALALAGKLPRTLQHILTEIEQDANDAEFNDALLAEARAVPVSAATANWHRHGQPDARLLAEHLNMCSGPGHMWVTDNGIRTTSRGVHLTGIIPESKGGALRSRYFTIACRMRLMLPQSALFEDAVSRSLHTREIAGLRRPMCQCSVACKDMNREVDEYMLHPATKTHICGSTTRHNALVRALYQIARLGNISASIEYQPYKDLDEPEGGEGGDDGGAAARQRLDLVLHDLPVTEARRLPGVLGLDRLTGLRPDDSVRLLTDLTVRHAGPSIAKLSAAGGPSDPEALGTIAAADKARTYGAHTRASGQVLLALPVSTLGRLYEPTDRFLSSLLRLAAARSGYPTSSAANHDGEHPLDVEPMSSFERFHRRRLSILLMSETVAGTIRGMECAVNPNALTFPHLRLGRRGAPRAPRPVTISRGRPALPPPPVAPSALPSASPPPAGTGAAVPTADLDLPLLSLLSEASSDGVESPLALAVSKPPSLPVGSHAPTDASHFAPDDALSFLDDLLASPEDLSALGLF